MTGQVIRSSKATATRYERPRPGELVHLDVKKIGRIPDGGGWRAHGRASGSVTRDRSTRVGYDYVHSLVDDHSRLAYSEILPDEKGATCAGFLVRVIDYFAHHGITRIERLMTDNAWAYRYSPREVCAQHGIRQKFIKPHCRRAGREGDRFGLGWMLARLWPVGSRPYGGDRTGIDGRSCRSYGVVATYRAGGAMSQWVIGLLGPASQVLLAGVLILAALAKTLALREVTGTLEGLGVRRVLALPAGAGIVAAELAAGAGLLVSPAQVWPRVLVVALAVAFAVAGLWAVLTRRQVPCNCFGNLRREILGWRQVALLPCWLALAAAAQSHPPAWGARQGLFGLAVLLAGLACARLPQELRLWRGLRGDRLAIDEGLRPPPRKLAQEGSAFE